MESASPARRLRESTARLVRVGADRFDRNGHVGASGAVLVLVGPPPAPRHPPSAPTDPRPSPLCSSCLPSLFSFLSGVCSCRFRTSFARSRYASLPRDVGSYCKTGIGVGGRFADADIPGDAGLVNQIAEVFAGIFLDLADRLLRMSNMVSTTPSIRSAGLADCRTSRMVSIKLRQAFEREEFRLQRHQDGIRRHHRIHRQKVQRGRAIHQDDIEAGQGRQIWRNASCSRKLRFRWKSPIRYRQN